MTIEKDILRLLSKNETSYHEIISQLKDRYEDNQIGISITKLTKEKKIFVLNEDKFIYKISYLGKHEHRNIVIRFYLNHWKILLPIIVGSTIAIVFGVLNYIK